MAFSSGAKTTWSSGSDRMRQDVGETTDHHPPIGWGQVRAAREAPPTAAVELNDVALRFVRYVDKHYSLKRAALDLLLRRASSVPANHEFWALQHISLRMNQGERIGLVGCNGAGKSTLLRLLARIYPPTSGSIVVRGNVAPLIEMGAGFNPELSGRDNILLNGAMLGISRKEMLPRVEEILEFTELGEFADTPLKYYSSGMYMRLAFSIATQIEPDILLIDESLSVGDAAFLSKAKARIRGLLNRSNLVVLVSHDMEALRELCDRGIWLSHGQVVKDGPMGIVIDDYLEHVRALQPVSA